MTGPCARAVPTARSSSTSNAGCRRHDRCAIRQCAAVPAQSYADPALRLAQPIGAPGAGPDQVGQRLREGAPRTGWIATVEPTHLERDGGRCRKGRQVRQASAIATVNGAAQAVAAGTSAGAGGPSSADHEAAGAIPADILEVATRHGTKKVHPSSHGDARDPDQRVESLRRYPRKVRENHETG